MNLSHQEVLNQVCTSYLEAISRNELTDLKARHFMFRYLVSMPDANQNVNFSELALPITEKAIKHLAANTSDLTPLLLYEHLRTGFYADFLEIERKKLSTTVVKELVADAIAGDLLITSTYKAICIVYYAYYQGYCDSRAELRKRFESLGKEDFTGNSYYYGLTHFVICDSNFYLRSPRETFWALELLQSEIKSITETQSLDLMVEAQLTAVLLNSELFSDSEFSGLISEYYDEDAGFFKRLPDSDLSSEEHTNSLFMMVLAQKEFNWVKNLS